MTGRRVQHHPRIDGAELRQRLAAVAIAIACTEDQVAETLERMALVLPENAGRLQAHAAQAREYATVERGRAAILSVPAGPGTTDGPQRIIPRLRQAG
jgi:hypothetical protein